MPVCWDLELLPAALEAFLTGRRGVGEVQVRAGLQDPGAQGEISLRSIDIDPGPMSLKNRMVAGYRVGVRFGPVKADVCTRGPSLKRLYVKVTCLCRRRLTRRTTRSQR